MSAARFGHIADITRLRKVMSGLIRFPVFRRKSEKGDTN